MANKFNLSAHQDAKRLFRIALSAHGITQRDWAIQTGISSPMLTLIINGKKRSWKRELEIGVFINQAFTVLKMKPPFRISKEELIVANLSDVVLENAAA